MGAMYYLVSELSTPPRKTNVPYSKVLSVVVKYG